MESESAFSYLDSSGIPMSKKQIKKYLGDSLSLDLMLQIKIDSTTGYKWLDENGNSIDFKNNSDPNPVLMQNGTYNGIKVTRVPVDIQRFKPATTDEDFEIIFKNEFQKEKVEDIDIFLNSHCKAVKFRAKSLKETHPDSWNYELIERTERYIQYLLKRSETKNTEVEISIDYSKNNDAEKIVFLNQLGILEFLNRIQPFNTSTNKLAEVISAFTGIKQTTAQSYLNPIFSKDVDKSKSPLTEKNIKSVNEKLLKMGFLKH